MDNEENSQDNEIVENPGIQQLYPTISSSSESQSANSNSADSNKIDGLAGVALLHEFYIESFFNVLGPFFNTFLL
jgi:hypothetical protein